MRYSKEKQQEKQQKSICEGVNYLLLLLLSNTRSKPKPSPTRQRTGQAPRGREPPKNKASVKEARHINKYIYLKEKQQKLDVNKFLIMLRNIKIFL